jgi:hypothetical protein
MSSASACSDTRLAAKNVMIELKKCNESAEFTALSTKRKHTITLVLCKFLLASDNFSDRSITVRDFQTHQCESQVQAVGQVIVLRS